MYSEGGRKIMKKFLKEAVVLLIVMAMIFSTIAVANTNTQSQITLTKSSQGSGTGARDDIVWDNWMNYDGLLAAQEPSSQNYLDAYPADDFHFEEDTVVCDVHWIGGYWNGDPQEWDWCIAFYHDRGDGMAPGSIYLGEFCYSWADINKEEIAPGEYEMWVYLPENYMFYACEKYWISIWAVGDHYPQSGWGYHISPILLHQAVLKSDWFGVPDWTDTSELLGYPVDMCFQLTTKEGNPSIDVEKYVWDPKNQEWVDADSESTALELPKNTDATFKIVIHNNGDVSLFNIIVDDKMHDSLEFIAADPTPDEIGHTEPFWYMIWHFPGPLNPCDTIEIYITAKVKGPVCSYDYNYVLVSGDGVGQTVQDEDYCYVHAIKNGKSVNLSFIQWLESHLNVFPIIQKLLKLLGLY
jgi:hypothetical protein